MSSTVELSRIVTAGDTGADNARAAGFEPASNRFGRCRSTVELHPREKRRTARSRIGRAAAELAGMLASPPSRITLRFAGNRSVTAQGLQTGCQGSTGSGHGDLAA